MLDKWFWPAGGVKLKVRGSPKSIGFILWGGSWMSSSAFMAIHPLVEILGLRTVFPQMLWQNTHIVCFEQHLFNMMWAMRYEENMHKWVTRGVQDMRDNTNLHDYTDRWVIYLRLCLTAISDEGRMSGIWSFILSLLPPERRRIPSHNCCVTVRRCKMHKVMFMLQISPDTCRDALCSWCKASDLIHCTCS